MSAVINARKSMADLGTKAQAVLDDTTLSGPEKMTRLDAYQVELKGFSETISIHEKAQALMSGAESAPEAKAIQQSAFDTRSLGRQVIESDAFIAAVEAKGGRFAFNTEIGTKAVTVDEGGVIAGGLLNGAGGVMALPNYLPGIVEIRYAPLAVSSLFAQGATTSPIVSYVKEATETQAAAAVAEKALKPQADATFARVNEQVGKIAAFFKITDEMMQDVAQMESFLSNRLVAQVGREEENEVLNGVGYPALAGVLGRAGLVAPIAATVGTIANPMLFAEAIFQQRTILRTQSFVEPDAVVINPIDWQYMQLAKDGNKQYFSGGPFTGSYGNGGYSNVAALWGLQVVTTPRMASGTALIGGYNECGQLFRRQGVTVEMTNSNVDDFQNNLITVRAESRAALAIYRPSGFGKVNVTWA